MTFRIMLQVLSIYLIVSKAYQQFFFFCFFFFLTYLNNNKVMHIFSFFFGNNIPVSEVGFGTSTLSGKAFLGKYNFAWFQNPCGLVSTCSKHWANSSAQFDKTKSRENPNLGVIMSQAGVSFYPHMAPHSDWCFGNARQANSQVDAERYDPAGPIFWNMPEACVQIPLFSLLHKFQQFNKSLKWNRMQSLIQSIKTRS